MATGKKQARAVEFSSDDDDNVEVEQVLPRASTDRTLDKGGSNAQNEKYLSWVAKMSDQNLFDALCACNRKPGPIVDSTRALYRKVIVNLLDSEESSTLARIEDYLAQNPGAREGWISSGLEVPETNGVTNGNSKNGFSDSDDDEAVETASRASRSSSKRGSRGTPARNIRTPDQKGGASNTRMSREHTESQTEFRRQTREVIEEVENDIGADIQPEMFSTPKSSAYPSSVRRRAFENYEDTPGESYAERFLRSQNKAPEAPPPKSTNKLVFYVVLFVIIAILGCSFYYFNKQSGPEEPKDELDVLINGLDEMEESKPAVGEA